MNKDNKDYKKLYEELLAENEKLRQKIMELEDQDKKRENEFNREKRQMQRKISELEEELKGLEQLKNDNQRLKDENGALIRVISKLSKWLSRRPPSPPMVRGNSSASHRPKGSDFSLMKAVHLLLCPFYSYEKKTENNCPCYGQYSCRYP